LLQEQDTGYTFATSTAGAAPGEAEEEEPVTDLASSIRRPWLLCLFVVALLNPTHRRKRMSSSPISRTLATCA
jgi:hypothetical protein